MPRQAHLPEVHATKQQTKPQSTIESLDKMGKFTNESTPLERIYQERQLADLRFSGIQRQIVANRIGSHYGNNQLQRLIELPKKTTKPVLSEDLSIEELGNIQTRDVKYEIIAHEMAYENTIGERDQKPENKNKAKADKEQHNELLVQWGYCRGWQDTVLDIPTGFFAGLLLPRPDRKDLKPIVAFRGSESESFAKFYKDWILNDANPEGIGTPQFKAAFTKIRNWLATYQQVDMTGHSLGAALAQKFTAYFPSHVRRLVTFQSPGISSKDANRYERNVKSSKQRPSITHHIATGDIVDFGGEAHLSGTVYQHDVVTSALLAGRGPVAHTSMLLDTNLLHERVRKNELKGRNPRSANISPTKRFKAYPYETKRYFAEKARKNLLTGVPLIVPVIKFSPAIINSILLNMSQTLNSNPDYVARLPVEMRIKIIKVLLGDENAILKAVTITGDEAENAILSILQVSRKKGDLVKVVNAIDFWRLFEKVNYAEAYRMSSLFRKGYYDQIPQQRAFEIIERCVFGGTSDLEEHIVTDIIDVRQSKDGLAIIKKLADFGTLNLELRLPLPSSPLRVYRGSWSMLSRIDENVHSLLLKYYGSRKLHELRPKLELKVVTNSISFIIYWSPEQPEYDITPSGESMYWLAKRVHPTKSEPQFLKNQEMVAVYMIVIELDTWSINSLNIKA